MRSLRSRHGWPPRTADAGALASEREGVTLLGSGRAVSLGVGTKAGLLDLAARAGLPVPAGFVLLDGAEPVVEWRHGAVGALAVRSAFSVEDGDHESLAGLFRTELGVVIDGVGDAVRRVRASAEGHGRPARRDVLVMEMVDATHAGVAFSEAGTYDDIVNVVSGTAERLVSGQTAGERCLLPRLEPADSGWRRRLQRLLRDVRDEFGDLAWDVEWADDGRRCWLVQLRPITRPTRRNEALTIANHAEILPELPSLLMTSLIAEAGPDLFAWYRAFDPGLPADRPFLEVVAGRPFINLSLLEDMLRHLGLPTVLVADSIGGPPDLPRPPRPARMVRKLPVLARMGAAQVSAVVRSRRNDEIAASFGARPLHSFSEAIAELHAAYVHLVTGMFPLSSAIGPPLAILRRTGTLVEHAGRHRTVTTELAEMLDVVHRSGDSDARRALLDRFGHRAVYESDIARPRFRDEPSLLNAEAGAVTGDRAASAPMARTVVGRLTTPVWMLARPPIAARERRRDAAMRGFAVIRDQLVELARSAVDDGRLPSADHLWMLDTDEARRLDEGWCPGAPFWEARVDEIEELAQLDPPPVVHRFDDPADWSHGAAPDGARLHGLSLTTGVVRGRAWVLREPSLELPAGFDPASTVLVARSIDAGWIPTFRLAAAVVVETGGDLSHGSILVRERGLPAVTNVRNVTRSIETGELVEVRADAGVVERLTGNGESNPTMEVA